jgi:hypothetical protein
MKFCWVRAVVYPEGRSFENIMTIILKCWNLFCVGIVEAKLDSMCMG